MPFENLDLHLGRPYALTLDHLARKMVARRRGGFCYELNLLLAGALRGLGFHVEVLEGQMRRREGGFGPPFDHMTLRVALPDGDWLADVGVEQAGVDVHPHGRVRVAEIVRQVLVRHQVKPEVLQEHAPSAGVRAW